MRFRKIIVFVLITTFVLANMIPVHAAGTTVVNVTNIDALKVVVDAAGIVPKKIVNAKDWKEGYIQAAHEQKIIDQTAFRKKLTIKITKEGTAELFSKALKVTTDKKIYFADTKNININALYALKVVDGVRGKDGKLYFKPTELITKTELTAIAAKAGIYYKAKQKPAVPTPETVVKLIPVPAINTYTEPSAQPDESSCH